MRIRHFLTLLAIFACYLLQGCMPKPPESPTSSVRPAVDILFEL